MEIPKFLKTEENISLQKISRQISRYHPNEQPMGCRVVTEFGDGVLSI